ncbi:MAG: nuclear transport factor 2 family protein [Woeseiaceae bacterium]
MNTLSKLVLSSIAILFATTGIAFAEEATDDHANVWAVIEEQWNAVEKGDKKWAERLLSKNFMGWGKTSPAPRSKSSTEMWYRFDLDQSQAVAHELYPLSIVVDGDVAVAHYLYTVAVKHKSGDVETSNGRYTDVLTRTDNGWKFLAWHGGDD